MTEPIQTVADILGVGRGDSGVSVCEADVAERRDLGSVRHGSAYGDAACRRRAKRTLCRCLGLSREQQKRKP